MKSSTQEDIERSIVLANGLFATAVTMVVPTRATLVLAMKNGDTAATAKVMGLMSSCAAMLELFINPVFGRLSDTFGRKPFLLIAMALDSLLHGAVASRPKSLPVMFADRVISGSMIFCFLSPLNAALADIYGTGPTLTQKTARLQMYYGIGACIGPLIGAKLGGRKSFAVSAALFAATYAWISQKLPETLADENRKPFDLLACSPLRFLKLFRQKMTATLAATIGLQSFGDYLNIYDINFLYLKSVLGYGTEQVGHFASLVGVSQIANGQMMKSMSAVAGRKGATAISNAMYAAAMVALGTSRSTLQVALAVVLMAFGHLRAGAVTNYLQHHGQAEGMGAAEIEAAKANLTAVLKVFMPIMYGNIFAWATSHGRSIPGLPYFLIAVLTGVAQLTFSSADPEEQAAKRT